MTEVSGLPAHVLLVHAVIVLLPLAALCVAVSAVWPAARRRLGIVTPLLAIAVAILVPVTANAGEWLLPRVGGAPLAVEHAGFGRTMWWWSTALAVVAIAQYLWSRRAARGARGEDAESGGGDGGGPRWVAVVLLVLALAVPAGAVFRTVQTGESGTRAVWEGSFSTD
ncbi:conserved hypothetical protein [Beutenbergia cavernae DSM 12333]|uniref:DUF2231 domain-containing protein n=1 Tax=Beutenbergia cavernae (strain ATCC BAA-8 / DSM 12333 / CCUG 43141 / JCM 11478 / NBRC 16432 / NCIMB 13614 / HKI 0122) TaxID=471853 RepID=C5BVR6_BEUC1|nr:DUF2231 domain-containing protein [Beutenbergia cavernae]ACQ78506.1 conserved hypothetical protein [Beutenbergia cavernae DSM 12333]